MGQVFTFTCDHFKPPAGPFVTTVSTMPTCPVCEVATLRAELEAARQALSDGIIKNGASSALQILALDRDTWKRRTEKAEACSLVDSADAFKAIDERDAAIARAERAEAASKELRRELETFQWMEGKMEAAIARAEHAEGLVEKLVAKCDLLARVAEAARSVDSVEDAHSFVVLSLALQELDGVRSGEAQVTEKETGK